jgi:hypothetical protein
MGWAVVHEDTGRKFALRPGLSTIGRVAPACVTVNHATISRKHAELEWTHNGPRSDAAAAPLLLVRDTSKFGATSVNDVKLGVGGEREAKPGDTLFVRTAGTNRWPSSSSPQKGGTDNCKFSDGPEEVGIGDRE